MTEDIHHNSTFTKETAEAIIELIAEGLTDREIAAKIGCHWRTLRKWRHRYAEFAQACKEAKEHVDEKVEMSLFQRAIGYRTSRKVVFQDKKTGEIIREETEEVWPPDTTAAIFWLKNRQKERWRDVWHIKVDPQPELPTTLQAIEILKNDFATLPPEAPVKVEEL